MLRPVKSSGPEMQLLLACARVIPTSATDSYARQLLEEGIDWARFVQKALDHGLVGLVGHTVMRVAQDVVPEDIANAFRIAIGQTRKANEALLEDLVRVVEALRAAGIETIPFKGPVLTIQAYGDLALRKFRDLDFLIQDADLPRAIAVLHGLGYERPAELSTAQLDLIHLLQGQDVIFCKNSSTVLEPHTRLTPIKMALDIDYAGLWRRAKRTRLNGQLILTMAPEDELLTLAIHGGKELWWNIKWACDFSVFVGSYPQLDWHVVVERARAWGCLHMLLLATSLARRHFGTAIPDDVVAAEQTNSYIAPMMDRVLGYWQSEKPVGPPSNKVLSMDRLRLHDGFLRQARYTVRTMFLPGPHHVAAIPLPRGLRFCYVPIKLAHDIVVLPLWRASREALAYVTKWRDILAGSSVPLSLIPISPELKANIRQHRTAHRDASRLLTAEPENSAGWFDLAEALIGLKRYKEAVACYDKALAIEPDNPRFWRKRNAARAHISNQADPLTTDPQDATAWAIRAGRMWDSKHYVDASDASDRALALDPGNDVALRIGVHARLLSCNWNQRDDDERRIGSSVVAGLRVMTPIFHRAIRNSEAEHLTLSRLWAKAYVPLPRALWNGERYDHQKIRIAYVSTDFRDHVVSDVIAGCLENHDRSCFEITAISLHPSDESAMRRRIESAVDRFLDVNLWSNSEIAAKLRELEIDIAVDLNGNSGVKRIGIFTRRPAPVQVNYLGYPGTMGASYLDYIIADPVVIPEESRVHYAENVVYLPHTFFPCDQSRTIATKGPSRADAGLPETGFVFTCQNAAHKIGPHVFEVWMRLLRAVEGSVLWLRTMDPAAMESLWREAKSFGIARERLVFAPHLSAAADHLARLRLADLFLDTIPYNAHATASDALWVGLPVLTCLGNTFPGRVAASLLHAVGLPEMVTTSLAEYEELALKLAQNPDRLAAVKAKLERSRLTEPLFDTARYTRDLERAFTMMWERQQTGLHATAFSVLRQDRPREVRLSPFE